ncbi:hypothetical protein ACFXAE_10495 [Streptomyces sp. NPDC059454]|uniref:hypothetical protein n=1 Tax=Streptomyces sp. NPDC059454 TaxID=3346836 RepID=UPI0036AC19A7
MAGGADRSDSLATQDEVSWAAGKVTAVCEVPADVPACARPEDVVRPQDRVVVDAYDAAGVRPCARRLVQADPAGR